MEIMQHHEKTLEMVGDKIAEIYAERGDGLDNEELDALYKCVKTQVRVAEGLCKEHDLRKTAGIPGAIVK